MNPLLEEWFGGEVPTSGEGLQTTLEQNWPLPLWATAVIVAALIGWVLLWYLREKPTDGSASVAWWKYPIYALIALLAPVPLAIVSILLSTNPLMPMIVVLLIWPPLLGAWVAGGVPLLRRVVLPLLRVELIAVILVMMVGHTLRPARTDLPDLVVVIDDSASMEFNDPAVDAKVSELVAERVRAAGFEVPSRFNMARAFWLEDGGARWKELEKRYRVKLYWIGESARAASGGEGDSPAEMIRRQEPRQQASRLGAGFRQILEAQRGRPTAAVILVSDGITSEGETLSDAADYARRKQIPLFTVAVGSPQPARDVRLHDLAVDPVVFVDDVVHFDFQMSTMGLAGQTVRLRLLEKGKDEPLATQDVTLDDKQRTQSMRLRHIPRVAKESVTFIVEAIPLPGEVDSLNNRLEKTISIRDETVRVLLVQSGPSFEFRYLKGVLERALKSGGKRKAVALATVLQEADKGYASSDSTARAGFPVRRDELLEKFDVVIFGDVNPQLDLTPQAMTNLKDFVEQRGGGVVFVAGPKFTPLSYRGTDLEKILPFDMDAIQLPAAEATLTTPQPLLPARLGMSREHLQLADNPAENIAQWQRLPGVFWLAEINRLKPGAQVLLEHATRSGADGQKLPAAILQYVGSGKVLFHATDETWRWRYRQGDGAFARYWLQTIRFLSRSKLLGQDDSAELATDRQEYRQGEPVRLRVRFLNDGKAPAADDGVTVEVQQVGGIRRRLQLRRDAVSRGIFEGSLLHLPQGDYQAYLAAPTLAGKPPATRFTITAPPGELSRRETDEGELREAATRTHGKFYRWADAGSLVKDLPPGREVPVQSLPPVPIWNSWPLAALIAIVLVTEWLVRKDAGLL